MRFIVRLLVLLFIVALLLAIFTPSILSTHFGKEAVIRFIEKTTGYKIKVQELKLTWLKGQFLEGVDVTYGPQDEVVFHSDKITSSAPLWKIAFYHDVGELHVESPTVVIHPPAEIAHKLAMKQAGFSLSWTYVPSFHLLGEIEVSHGTAQFVTPGLDPISVSNIDMTASLLPQQIKLAASGQTEEASKQGTFQVHLLAYPGTHQIDATLQIHQFPLRAADQIVSILYPDLKGVIRGTIGESLNADLRLKNLQDNLDLYLKASADYFSANIETKVEQDTLMLASPALIQFQIPAQGLIKSNVNAQIKLDQLSIPLQNHRQFTAQGTLKSDTLVYETWTLEPFSLFVGTGNAGNWNIKVDSAQVQFNGSLHLPEDWHHLSLTGQALLPKNSKLDIAADSLQSINLVAQGDLWQGRFKLSFDPLKQTISLKEPGFLTYHLSQLPDPLPPLLKEPLPVQIMLEPCTLHLHDQSGLVKGTVQAPAFDMGTSHVDAASLQFTGDLKTKQLLFSLTSTIENSPLSADGTLFWPSKLTVKGSCKDLPVRSIQPFLTKGPLLQPLLGDRLTTNFEATLSETASSLQLKTDSPLLALQMRLASDGKQLKLLQPGAFTWKLTPEGYSALTGWMGSTSLVTLSTPALFKGSIEMLELPLSDQTLNSLKYQCKMTADQLTFVSDQKENKISQFQVSLAHTSLAAPHEFDISGRGSPQGTLSCKGSWSLEGAADIHLLLSQFPTAGFDLFITPFESHHFSLVTLCGPTLNLSLDTTLNEWTGPVKFELNSSNLRSSLKGSLNQGVLTLTDTLHLQLNLSTPLSKMLFQEMNPLSLSSVRSTGPITLEISPKGFSYPIYPSNLSKIQIGSGHLELGRLLCQNEGNVQVTLGLLKLGQYRSGDELELWFAPLDFRVQDGILKCERTELLIAENLQVCLWGNVDLPDNSVDAILGLTASCLRSAFGIKNLPNDYVLQIPLRGTLTDVKINKGAATTKIAALLVWEQKGSVAGAAKGPAGALLGEMLNKLGPLPGGDQKAPPTKRPFPWESAEPSTKKKTSEAEHPNKKHIHPKDSPLKQVFKLIR